MLQTQLRIKLEERGSLYWNQYQYSVMFYQKEIGCARSFDSRVMAQSISRRRLWNNASNPARGDRFSDEVIADLGNTLDLLKSIKDTTKITFCSDWCYVYTNDFDVVDRIIKQTPNSNYYTAKQAVITHDADTIVVAEPQFKFRTYFKERDVGQDRVEMLHNWVSNQGEQIQPSKVMKRWLNGSYSRWNSHRCQRHFYIEHNDRKYETMMSLLVPGLIRKTVSVVARE